MQPEPLLIGDNGLRARAALTKTIRAARGAAPLYAHGDNSGAR